MLFRRRIWIPLIALGLAAVLSLITGRSTQASVGLLYFYAQSGLNSITLVWETGTELNNLGFNIWRDDTGTVTTCTNATRVNPSLIPSQVGGQPIGALYQYEDITAQAGVTYRYWLESIDVYTGSECHLPPVEASLGGGNPISTPDPGSGGSGSNPTSTTAPSRTPTTVPTNTPPPAATTPADGGESGDDAAPSATVPADSDDESSASNPPQPTNALPPAGSQPQSTPQPPVAPATGSENPSDNPAPAATATDDRVLPAAISGPGTEAPATGPGVIAAAAGSNPETQAIGSTTPEVQAVGQGLLPATHTASAAEADAANAGNFLSGRLSTVAILVLLTGLASLLLGIGVALWLALNRRPQSPAANDK